MSMWIILGIKDYDRLKKAYLGTKVVYHFFWQLSCKNTLKHLGYCRRLHEGCSLRYFVEVQIFIVFDVTNVKGYETFVRV